MGFGDMGAVLVTSVNMWDRFLEVKDMLVHMLRWLENWSTRARCYRNRLLNDVIGDGF